MFKSKERFVKHKEFKLLSRIDRKTVNNKCFQLWKKMYIVYNIYLIIHGVCRDLSWLDMSSTRTNSNFLSYRCLFTLSDASCNMIHVFEGENDLNLKAVVYFKRNLNDTEILHTYT